MEPASQQALDPSDLEAGLLAMGAFGFGRSRNHVLETTQNHTIADLRVPELEESNHEIMAHLNRAFLHIELRICNRWHQDSNTVQIC